VQILTDAVMCKNKKRPDDVREAGNASNCFHLAHSSWKYDLHTNLFDEPPKRPVYEQDRMFSIKNDFYCFFMNMFYLAALFFSYASNKICHAGQVYSRMGLTVDNDIVKIQQRK